MKLFLSTIKSVIKAAPGFIIIHPLPVIVLLFALSASQLCWLIFPSNNYNWWWLRAVFYSLEVALSFYVLSVYVKRYANNDIALQAFFFVCSGVFFSDSISKFFEEYGYSYLDIPLIITTVFIAHRNYGRK